MAPKRKPSKPSSKDSQKITTNPPRAPHPPLVQPPQPRLHQQEQSQPLAPQLRQQELSRPPRPRVTIIHELPPQIFQTTRDNFKTTVERLTGRLASPSTTLSSSLPSTSAPALQLSPGLLSPATWGAATVTENANISNELGFVGSDRYHHQNQSIDREGILSPISWFAALEDARPTYPPSILPDFFSPVAPNNPQDVYYWNQQRHLQQPPIPHGGPLERPRSDFGHDMHNNYLSLDDLDPQSGQTPSIPSEEVSPFDGAGMRILGGNYIMSSSPMGELMTGPSGILPPDFGPYGRPMDFGQQYLVGHDMHNSYLPLDDLYPQSGQTPSTLPEEVSPSNGAGMRILGGNNIMSSPAMGELMTGNGGILPPYFGSNGRLMGFGQQDLVGHDMHNSYFSLDNLYPQSGQTSSIPSEEVGQFNGAGMGILGGNNIMSSPAMSELSTGAGGILHPDFGPDGRPMGFGQQDVVGHDIHNSYLSLDDLYPQSGQTPSVPSEEVGPFNGAGMGMLGGNNIMSSPAMSELTTGAGGILPPDFGSDGRPMGFGQQYLAGRPGQELLNVTPDASNTLFVEGIPSGYDRFMVSRIFRQFLGYREVRLLPSKHRNGDNIVLCFVDFETPACAATALNALQGYRIDEEDPGSSVLRLQFSRNPGPRPGQGGGRRQ